MGINFGDMSNQPNTANITEVNTPTGGVTLDLAKGALLDITKREPGLKNVIVGAGWDANTSVPAYDLDVSAFMLNSNMKITSANDIIFFNHKSAPGITLLGDNLTGSGEGDDEQIEIHLDEIPTSVAAIDFVVNIFEASQRRQTFGMVQNSYIRLLNHDKNDSEICRFRLKEDYGTATAVIFARLIRNGSEWEFKTIADGKVVRDLNDIAALYS